MPATAVYQFDKKGETHKKNQGSAKSLANARKLGSCVQGGETTVQGKDAEHEEITGGSGLPASENTHALGRAGG